MTTSEFLQKLSDFRQLRQQRKAIGAAIRAVRQELSEFHREFGDYTDDEGWVKEMVVKGRWSCLNPEQLAAQAQVWAESEDISINTLGKTVMTFLRLPPDTTHINIK